MWESRNSRHTEVAASFRISVEFNLSVIMKMLDQYHITTQQMYLPLWRFSTFNHVVTAVLRSAASWVRTSDGGCARLKCHPWLWPTQFEITMTSQPIQKLKRKSFTYTSCRYQSHLRSKAWIIEPSQSMRKNHMHSSMSTSMKRFKVKIGTKPKQSFRRIQKPFCAVIAIAITGIVPNCIGYVAWVLRQFVS